jgi:hypothetical protein
MVSTFFLLLFLSYHYDFIAYEIDIHIAMKWVGYLFLEGVNCVGNSTFLLFVFERIWD